MEPNVSDWTIVVPGAWNIAILNPGWIATKIFEATEIEVEGLFEPYATQMRFNHQQVSITPRPDRLVIGAKAATENAMRAVEYTALKFADELPVTPVQSVGINFGFTERNANTRLVRTFDQSDNDLLADADFAISETTVLRSMKTDDVLLNLRLRKDQDQTVHFHFNFHFALISLTHLRGIIEGRSVSLLDQANRVLSTVYQLETNGEE